jgi:hypothetical protein
MQYIIIGDENMSNVRVQSQEEIINDIIVKIWNEVNESIEESIDVSYV